MPDDKELRCECGYEVSGTEEAELITDIRRHAREAHGIALSVEDALLVVLRSQLEPARHPVDIDTRDPRVGHFQRRVITGSIVAFVVAAAATVAAFGAVLPASGDAGPPRGDPATFVIRVVDLVVSDDYASVWPSLYPPHQDVAPRDEYVSCELRTPVGWKLRSAKVIKVVERRRRVPGDDSAKPVSLVTLRLRILNRALHTEGAFTHTFTAVADGSRWTWILTASRYRLYRDDACGDSAAGMPVHASNRPASEGGSP